jgi:DNA-binding Xre family transcriptional regulator
VIYDTRFDQFLHREQVKLDDLAEAARISRQNIGRLRSGETTPRQDTIARVVLALRSILSKSVKASDVFYLGEEQDDDTPEARRFLRPASN